MFFSRFNSLEHERQQKLKYEKQLAQIQNYVKKSPLHPKILQDPSNLDWCHGFLKYLDPPGPLTALASYPGSGNTWIRYLLQQATGIVMGSNSKKQVWVGFEYHFLGSGRVWVPKMLGFPHVLGGFGNSN